MTTTKRSGRRTVPCPDDARIYTAALLRELGAHRAAAHFGLSRYATLAVATGQPVMRGSVAIIQATLRADMGKGAG
jgi:hypothetical protein